MNFEEKKLIENKKYFVKEFEVKKYGLNFPNKFAHYLYRVGLFNLFKADAANGLCGGMCVVPKLGHKFGIIPPRTHTVPHADYKKELLDYIIRAQLATVNLPALWKYGFWTFQDKKRDREHLLQSWPKIKELLEQDQLVIIGLIRAKTTVNHIRKNLLNRNELQQPFISHHQVLVYGYEQLSKIEFILYVYDSMFCAYEQDEGERVEIKFNIETGEVQHRKQLPNGQYQNLKEIYTFFPINCNFNEKPPTNEDILCKNNSPSILRL